MRGVRITLLWMTLWGIADWGCETVRAADPPNSERVNAMPEWVGLKLAAATGGEKSLDSQRGERGTVLVFLSTECPISNGYVPTLNRLAKEFKHRGVEVVGLNPNAGHSLKDLEQHVGEYDLKFPVFKDVGGKVARALDVTTCPEVVLLNEDRRVVYQGRIDDRYSKRGGASRAVGRADLEIAISQLLAGETIAVVKTKTLGCAIDFPRKELKVEPKGTFAKETVPTYSDQISRLLQKHCQECHRAGGIGPFALNDYEDAVRWADDIASFTASRSMPPWKPTPGFGDFAHPRHMEQEEIDVIGQWVKNGCPEGDQSKLPAPRVFTDGWKLGREPDAVFEASEYVLGAEGPDEYRCFVIPTNFDGDRYVSAIEVRPGNDRVVHHVISFLDTTGKARALDERHEGPGYVTSAGFPGFLPTGGLGGWAPGNQPRELPTGIARLLPKGADIAMQVHYHRSGKQETDRTRIGVYFSQQKVERCVRNIPVLPLEGPLGDLVIPANDPHYQVRSSLVLPLDMQAVSVTPHMHLLGKDMTVIARLPDGSVKNLIQVNDWDFNWQESYQFREAVFLPRLTRIEVVAHFDNSAENPHNPQRPPVPVNWGESTNEEMCIAFVELVPARNEQASLKAPTRREQMRFFLESHWLDDQTPRLEKAKLLKRFADRISVLEEFGGVAPEEKKGK